MEAYAAQPHSLYELGALADCNIAVEISGEDKQQIFISFEDSLWMILKKPDLQTVPTDMS